MDKKVIIAIAVAVVFLLLYPYYMKKVAPVPSVDETSTEAMETDAFGEPVPALAPAPPTSATDAVMGKFKDMVGLGEGKAKRKIALKARDEARSVQETIKEGEEVVIVETPLYKAVISSIGGGIKSFELKNYHESQEEGSPLVNMSSKVGGEYPLQTRLKIAGLKENASFIFNSGDMKLTEGEQRSLKLSTISPNGTIVEKQFTFNGSTYLIDTAVDVTNGGTAKLKGSTTNVLTATYYVEFARFHSGPVTFVKEKASRLKNDDAAEIGRGGVKWLGLEDKFFLLAIMPGEDVIAGWKQDFVTESSARTELTYPLDLKPGAKTGYTFSSYIGPKEYKILKELPGEIEEAIEFGFFSFMAKPVLSILNFFQKFVVNYGIAIILLTVVIKIVFYPLTKKSLSSMKDMQKLQPQMKALKEKFKDDKQRQNKEVMELYKRHKVNPLGGCLPMVLQIPVFIALYEVLSVAIDLRHAPFLFWITDLSARDPYYISPILMGGSMFLQQKMSPSSMDPMQSKMMMMMPVVFTFLFLKFP
ncbi:MAG: membrane protein insertase YidC, partial [Thermodesulfobacteriota bacterium]